MVTSTETRFAEGLYAHYTRAENPRRRSLSFVATLAPEKCKAVVCIVGCTMRVVGSGRRGRRPLRGVYRGTVKTVPYIFCRGELCSPAPLRHAFRRATSPRVGRLRSAFSYGAGASPRPTIREFSESVRWSRCRLHTLQLRNSQPR